MNGETEVGGCGKNETTNRIREGVEREAGTGKREKR